jgi:hypothetical protein
MEYLGSFGTDFNKTWQSIFRKSVEKIQVALKSEKNNRYLTSRPMHICYNILLNFLGMRDVSRKLCRANENTHFTSNNIFPPESLAVCEKIMRKNMLEPDRPQMTIQYGAHGLRMLDK